jgi:ribosomal protein S18 acetylase RimI-like enzyme
MPTTTDRQDLRRALDMERGLLAAAAERADDHPLGIALHDEARARVWVHNQLHVTGPAGDIDDLVRILDELYGHLPHRRAVVEDEAEGERLAAGFRDRGWLAEVKLYMALREPRDREPEPGLAAEVDEERHREVERRTLEEEPATSGEEIVGMLLGARAAAHRVADSCRYVVGTAGDELVGNATLYVVGDLAQIEDVGTLEPYRRRGIGRAMVSLATDLAAGSELIWIAADEADWPKELYAKLGFRAVGRTYSFTRVGPEHPGFDAGVR